MFCLPDACTCLTPCLRPNSSIASADVMACCPFAAGALSGSAPSVFSSSSISWQQQLMTFASAAAGSAAFVAAFCCIAAVIDCCRQRVGVYGLCRLMQASRGIAHRTHVDRSPVCRCVHTRANCQQECHMFAVHCRPRRQHPTAAPQQAWAQSSGRILRTTSCRQLTTSSDARSMLLHAACYCSCRMAQGADSSTYSLYSGNTVTAASAESLGASPLALAPAAGFRLRGHWGRGDVAGAPHPS